MKKLVKENVGDLLKGKTNEQIKSLIKPGAVVPASLLSAMINATEIGETIKANFDGAWDRFGPVERASVITINRGNGFEDALVVENEDGSFLYTAPFKLDSIPDENTVLCFYCDTDSVFLKGQKLSYI